MPPTSAPRNDPALDPALAPQRADDDRQVVRLLAPTFALVTAANVIAVSFSKSLFLGHNPYSSLPWMFLGAATFTALAAAAYVHVLHRWSLRRRFPALVAAAAVSYAALGIGVSARPASLSLLAYTWCAGVGTLLVLQTWGHAQALLPVRQARRLFPRFAAAATLCAAVGGGLTTAALPVVGVQGLLYVATALLAAAYVLVRRSTTRLHEARLRPGAELAPAGARASAPRRSATPGKRRPHKIGHSGLRAGLRDLGSSALLRHIAGLSVALQVASIALDYQLSASLKATYDTAQLAAFFGVYYGAANLTTFALAALGSDRLARWLGVGPAVGAPAVALTAGAVGAPVAAGAGASGSLLAVLVATSFFERVATFGLGRPATAAALTPVDGRAAERARFLIDGVFLRLTTVAVSLVVLTSGIDLAAPASLTPAVLAAGVLAVGFALRVGRSYRAALATTLGPGALEALDASAVRAWTQREARRAVEARLDSGDPQDVLAGLELATRLGVGLDEARLERLVGPPERALDPGRTAVVVRALHAGAELGLGLPAAVLAPLISRRAPREVTRAALRLLSTGATPAAPLGDLLERLSQHDDPLVAALALLLLRPLRRAGPRPQPARRNLRWTVVERALGDERPPPPTVGAQGPPDAAVYDRLLRYLRALPSQLSARDPQARREAQLAMEALRLPALARPLIEALASPGPAPAALTALGRLGLDVVGPPLREAWGEGNRRDTHHRLRLLRAAEDVGAVDILLDALDGPSLTLRDFATLALWRLARAPGGVPPGDVEAFAAREIAWLETCAAADLGLARQTGERAAFVRDELALHRTQGEERTLRLLGIALDRPTFTRILAHYRSPYERTRSNAVELLDDVLRDTPHHRLVAYLEATDRRGPARSYTRAGAATPGAAGGAAEGGIQGLLTDLDPKLGAMLRWAHGVGSGGGLMDRAMLLHAISLFANTPADQLLALAEVCRPAAFEPGEVIFRPGDAATHLYLLERGQVEILREQRQVAVFGPREAFGELAILGRAERNTTARALGDVDSLVLAREDFEALLDVSPSLAKATIAVLTERLRTTLERLG